MSRKKFCLDRNRDLFLEIQPTFHRLRCNEFCFSILISFSAYWWRCHRVLLKGMSRKKFCLDRNRDLFLEIQPTFHRLRCNEFCFSILISFSAYWWRCHRVLLKGMSRKKFCLDRNRDLFLEIQPTFHRLRCNE